MQINGIKHKLNENFIFETRKNSAVILLMVKAFWAVMYQILAVNGPLIAHYFQVCERIFSTVRKICPDGRHPSTSAYTEKNL